MIKKCKMCGGKFNGFHLKQFCSNNCKNKYLLNKQREMNGCLKIFKICKICGKDFSTYYKRKIICDDESCKLKKEILNHNLYYEKNKYKIKERNKLWEINNESHKLWRKQYRINNKKYWVKKYHNDPNQKIKILVGSRIYQALKQNKTLSSSKYLGCNIKHYKKYLEEQFTPEMSWENHGSYWEIDHKIPLNTFDLTDLKQQKMAFNYKNTRPLLKNLNRSRPNNGSDLQ